MKKSVAYDHFPRVISQNNRFLLYNPILKKRYENRPEERVRLNWVEFLLLQTNWKKTRVGFETPVKLQQAKNMLRADLVLYSDSVEPSILIECKSHSVSLNQTVAQQAARYNSEVNAEYLVLTNGIEDYWFKKSVGSIHQASNTLNQHTPLHELKRDEQYWQQRGFCSSASNEELKSWISRSLDLFWSDTMNGSKQYLDFQSSLLSVPMNQYYKLFEIDSERRLAISFIGTKSSDCFLIGILNSEGVNKGIVSINLDELKIEESGAVIIFEKGEKRSVSTINFKPFNFSDFESAQIKNLPETLINFFD